MEFKKIDSLFGYLVPDNFFGILSSKNARDNLVLLVKIQEIYGNNLSKMKKKDLAEKLDEFIEENRLPDFDDGEEEEDANGLKVSKSGYSFLTYLKKTGWMVESVDGLDVMVSRSAGFLSIVRALLDLIQSATDPKEYSIPLREIYNSLVQFEPKDCYMTIQQIEKNIEEFKSEVASVSDNIRRFIQTDLSKQDQTESALLHSLLIDYQNYAPYKTFMRLTSSDSPFRYRKTIIDKLRDIRKNYVDAFREQYIEKNKTAENPDNETYAALAESADEEFYRVIDDTCTFLSELGGAIHDIEAENRRFVSINLDRIQFRFNQDENIEGKIDGLIRDVLSFDPKGEFDGYGRILSLPRYRFLPPDYHYKPKEKSVHLVENLTFHEDKISPERLAQIEKEHEVDLSYTEDAIRDFIYTKMGEEKTLLASQLKIESEEEALKIQFAPVFSRADKNPYHIIVKNTFFTSFGYKINDYLIERN